MKQAKVLSNQELKVVFAVIGTMIHAERNRCAVAISHYGGLRVGEIAALKIKHVIGSHDQIRDRIHLTADMTKGKHSRNVFVGEKLRRELKKYVKSLQNLVDPELPFFPSQKGGHFSPTTMCQLFSQLYAQAGIDGATGHSGRRTFITKLASNGVSAKVIMTLAGHRNLATTQRYIEVNDDMLKNAVETL